MRAQKSIFIVISILIFAFVIFLVAPTHPPFIAEAEDFDITSFITNTDGENIEFTIDSEVQLEYLLDDSNGYNLPTTTVVFANDITVTELYTDAEVKLNIDGNGYALIRDTYLTSAIFGTVSGTLKDLAISLKSLNESESGIVARTVSSSGVIDNVSLLCVWDKVVKCAFVETNNGLLNNCVSYVKANVVFYLAGTGDMTYCLDGTNYTNYLAKITVDGEEYVINDACDVIESVYVGTHYVSDYEYILCDHDSATFNWYQNETPVTDTFEDVDIYRVEIAVGGISIIQLFFIEKVSYSEHCDNEDLPIFSGIDGFTDQEFSYVGAPISIDEPSLNSALQSQLTSDGFTWSYSLSNTVQNVGEYTQTFTATSRNFLDVTFTRKITVNPAVLTAKLTDLTIKYSENADLTQVEVVSQNGTIGVDEGKTLQELLLEESKDFYDYLSTNYDLGDGIGAYDISFSLSSLRNYLLEIEKGTLAVTQLELDLSGIEFNDVSHVYNGQESILTAVNIPDGYTVNYQNNVYKNVGNITATAEFYLDENHTSASLSANIIVTPATLTVTPTNVTKDYGAFYRKEDFTLSFDGIMTGDSIDDINGDIQFDITAFDVDVTLSAGDIPYAGAYIVRLSTQEEPRSENYQYQFVDGILTINKISLTTVYRNNNNGANVSFDDCEVDYDASAHTRTIDAFESTDLEVNISYEFYNGGNLVDECLAVGEYLIVGTVTPIENTLTARNYVTTTYQCALIINKISPKIEFLAESYTFEYAYDLENSVAVDYALSDSFEYTTTNIPEGATVTTYCEQGKADRVGTFLYTAKYDGDENHEATIARVYFYVTAKNVDIGIKREFTYSANPIEMLITRFDYVGKGEGELTQSDFTFSYVNNAYNAPVEYVANAGEYTVSVVCNDNNYNLLTKSFVITVNKLTVDVTLGNMNITYGDVGEIVLDNGDAIYVYDNYVTRRNYYVASTDKYVDVSFNVQKISGSEYFSANTYTLNNASLVEDNNYQFNLVGNNAFTVKQRVLSVNWYVDGRAVYTGNSAFVYAGESLNSKITYGFINYAGREGINNVTSNLEIRKNGAKSELLHAGQYNLRVLLTNTPNYVIDAESNAFIVDILQVTLSVTINNATVMQYENFYMPTFSINGLRGADKDVPLITLDGYSFRMECAYNKDTARVGDTFSIGGAFTFTDYIVPSEYVYVGTLTVIDGYPEYTLPRATYVYDGTEKRIIIGDVMEGVTVRYENNVQRYVGTYNVTATITYPSGRTATLYSVLTIVQATPIVSVEKKYTAFRQGEKLTGDYLTASATNASGAPLMGSFAFLEEYSMLRGENKYKAKFVPTDAYNYQTVTFDVVVTSYVLDGGLVKISGGDYSYEDGSYIINKTLLLTLDKSSIEPISKKVSLVKDQAVVQSITLNKTESFTLRIKYLDEIMYTEEYKIEFVTGDIGDVDEVHASSDMLSLTSAVLKNDSKTIFVDDEGGSIKLDAKYKEEYTLYVNDTMVDTYTFKGDEESISIIIKNKTLGVSVYASTFKVERVEDPNNLPNQDGTNIEEQPKVVWQDWYGAVIGGVGGAIVLAVVLIFILRRRK